MFKKKKSQINLIKSWENIENIATHTFKKEKGLKKMFFKKIKEFRKKISPNSYKPNFFSVFLKRVGQIFLIILILTFLLAGASFLFLKDAYTAGFSGAKNIQQALDFAKNKDFQQAQKFSALAQDDFELAWTRIYNFRSNFIVSHTPFLNNQLQDIEYLVKTAEILSRSGEQGLLLAAEISRLFNEENNLSFSELETKKKQEIIKKIYESTPELNGIKANLELACLNLQQVKANGLLKPWQGEIYKLENQLGQISQMVNNAVPITQMLPILAGYPETSSFLVMLQNSDELRPTGGFLGTYGILEMQNGEILRFDTHDIYHMDMPVKDLLKVDPPTPIKKYLVDNWYLRDSNWSPDWPTSAKQIEWFFQEENKLLTGKDQINDFSGKFDGVIGITPEFIKNLLTLVGSVNIEGQEYDQDNFTEILEYRVEKGYVELGVPKWERKEIISEIAKKIKEKIFDLPVSRWQEIIKVINSNIYKKDILVYFHDEQLQNFGRELGWAGEIKEAEGDYFMVVDANLGAFKTDAVMNKSIDYKIEQNNDNWIAKLKINYSHYGDFDWRTTTYRTYTRVYVPSGSELIKAEGISNNDVEISNDLKKTVFGGFIAIDPGNMGSLYFEYKLPEKIKMNAQEGFYVLDVQKQPGNNINQLTVDLILPNEVKSYHPAGFSVERTSKRRIYWNTELEADRNFKVNF